jgi:hypothetical protein
MNRLAFLTAILFVMLFPAPLCYGEGGGVPMIRSLEPAIAARGVAVTAQGENLGALHVQSVMLTKANRDTTVDVLDQSATRLRFRVPASLEPGRYGVTILTTGKDAMLLEQPVFLTVEEQRASQ